MNENQSTSQPGNRAGVVGCVLSIVGCVFCGLPLLTIPGLIVSLVGLRREPKTAAIVGTVFGAVGLVGFIPSAGLMVGIMLPALSKAREMARETQTTQHMQQMHNAMRMYKVDHGSYPDSFTSLHQGSYISTNTPKDYWENKMRFEHSENNPPQIRSAGADGTFDTEDDLKSHSDGSITRGTGTQ